jgi:hypothetical protein
MKKNAKGVFDGTMNATTVGETYSYGWLVHVKGKLSKTKVSGTFDVTAPIIDNATGELVTTGYSGTTKFVASRKPGQIYGGMTAQHEPVVIRTNERRRKMSDFMFSWFASVSPEGFYHEGLAGWQNASLSKAGTFNINEAYPFDADGGNHAVLSYTAKGQVGKAAASGSLSAKYLETDPSGTEVARADSGSMSWRAITG